MQKHDNFLKKNVQPIYAGIKMFKNVFRYYIALNIG